MKINIPSDYHVALSTAIKMAQLNEEGRFTAAFDLVGFTDEAKAASLNWGTNLDRRRDILQRCETRLMLGGHSPKEETMEALDLLSEKISNLPKTGFLEISDSLADYLNDALETYTRLALGQVSQSLETFSFKGSRPNLRDEDIEVINDMRHLAITSGGASFGIGNKYLSDDVRNAWYARKVILHHLSYKRRPEGGMTVNFDFPMRLGSSSRQNIVIEDPDFKAPSSPYERPSPSKDGSGPSF